MQEIKNVVTWLKNWFYDKNEVYTKNETYTKEEVNTALGNKVNVNQGNENTGKNVYVNSGGKIDVENHITCGTGLAFDGSVANKINHSNSVTALTTASAKKIKHDAQGHITETSNLYGSDIPVSSSDSTKLNTALSNKANSTHTHSATDVTDTNTHTNIGSSAYATQGAINTAIDTAIGNLQSIKAIEVTTDKGSASADKLGKLFIVNENSKVNVYYVKQTGTGSSATYSWEKMDTDILDEYVVYWSNVQNRPTKTSDFTNDGADGTNVFVSNNDSRLSDARTPTSHQHGSITNDGKIGNASGAIITTGSGGVLQASTSLSGTKIDLSDMQLSTLDYPYPITTLEDYITDRDMKIQTITNVPSEMATILTHIDTYYNYYQ